MEKLSIIGNNFPREEVDETTIRFAWSRSKENGWIIWRRRDFQAY